MEQSPGRCRRSDTACQHILRQLGQHRLNLRLLAKRLLEPGVYALPHPGQRLLLAAVSKCAVLGLQGFVMRHGCPKTVYTLTEQGAELNHLRLPKQVAVGIIRVAV
jgi:hypothetical protein